MNRSVQLILFTISLFTLNSCIVEEVDIPPAPVVRIVSPTSSTTILDSTKILVEASDDRGIARIVLTIDGKVPPGGILYYEPYEYVWNIQGFADSSVHTIKATAYDTDSNTTATPTVTLVTNLFSPSNLHSFVAADTVLRFSWTDHSSKETGFELYESVNDSLFLLRQTIPANTTTTDLHGIFLSTNKYSYYLYAMIGGMRSKPTNTQTVQVILSPPQGIFLTAITDTMITVNWQAGTNSFEDSVEIEQRIGSGSFTKRWTVGRNILSASLPGSYKTGTSYAFRARAYSRYHISSYSSIVSTLVPFDAPSQLTVSKSTSTNITLNWKDNSSFEKGFSVERSTGGNSGYTEIHRTVRNVTSWTDVSVDTLQVYRYRVRAFSDSNISTYSQSLFASRFIEYQSFREMQQRASAVTSVKWRPNADQFASAHADGSIDIWNRTSTTPVRTISAASGGVRTIAFSTDGSVLGAGGGNGKVTLWDPATGSLLQTIQAHSAAVNEIDFSSDGILFVTAGSDSMVRTWNRNTGVMVKEFPGHSDTVTAVRFHPNGTSIISGSGDKTLRSWNAVSASQQWSYPLDAVNVNAIAFNKDGSRLAAAMLMNNQNNPVLIMNTSLGAPATQFPFLNVTSNVVLYSPNDKTFVTAADDGMLNTFDLNFDTIYSYFSASPSAVTSIAYDPSSTFLLTGTRPGKLMIWSVNNYWRYSYP